MTTEARLDAIAAIRRDDMEDYKLWLAGQPWPGGRTITKETHRQRMRTVRQFFEPIIEWDWPEAPARNRSSPGTSRRSPSPLPRFLDDRDAARLMTAARASTDPRDRLALELLAGTGMRAGGARRPGGRRRRPHQRVVRRRARQQHIEQRRDRPVAVQVLGPSQPGIPVQPRLRRLRRAAEPEQRQGPPRAERLDRERAHVIQHTQNGLPAQ